MVTMVGPRLHTADDGDGGDDAGDGTDATAVSWALAVSSVSLAIAGDNRLPRVLRQSHRDGAGAGDDSADCPCR